MKLVLSITKNLCNRVSLVTLSIIIAACGGYQAPVSEQGERQLVRAPIIIDDSAPDRGNNTPRDSVAVVDSSQAGILASQIYRVRAGDTLFSIAFQHDLDFRSLATSNNLNSPYTIFVGQEIDLNTPQIARSSSITSANICEPSINNSVARAQGSISRAGDLIRRAIGSNSEKPNWRWPHGGKVIRGFEADMNKGIDIGGKLGDPVFAASSGDVVYSGRGVQGSGNLIIIRHNDRYLSAYAHNSRMLVGEGIHVKEGDKIAEVGNSSNGISMLHFEIRFDGKSVDPTGLLPHR